MHWGSLLAAWLAFAPSDEEGSRRLLDRVVAVVNDEVVLLSELGKETQQSILWQEALTQLENAPREQVEAKRREVRGQVLDQMIDNVLVRKEAERFQIAVPDEQVQRYLQQIATDNGFATVEELRQQVEASGEYGSWDDYKNQLRNQLLVWQTVQMLASPSVTEAQIRAYYRKMTKDEGAAATVDRFVFTPRSADSRARDDAFAKAQAVTRRLRSGEAADKIATDLGYEQEVRTTLTRGAVAPVVEDAVFAAKKNEVVGPLDAGQGYVVIRIVAHQASQALSFEAAKDKIHEKLLMEASIKAEQEFKQSLRAKAHVDIRL